MIKSADAREYATELYTSLLGRSPGEIELRHWVSKMESGEGCANIFRAFVNSAEYRGRFGAQAAVPNGHYYSPVIDPVQVQSYFEKSRAESVADLSGIDVNLRSMKDLWDAFVPLMASAPFPDEKGQINRFYYDNKTYPYGDAVILWSMISYLKPKRIIEVGSGFSTACALDAIDQLNVSPRVTSIDPFPERLLANLWERDLSFLELIKMPVQDVPLNIFDEIDSGDILLIDSTHVLKTGSDVHFEIFKVFPRLKKGAVVHIHDIPFPFEYHPDYIYKWGYSWNEAYALRAFLMYNERFRILFWNSLMSRLYARELERSHPRFLRSPGSGLWLLRL